jgi:hypothetical protein
VQKTSTWGENICFFGAAFEPKNLLVYGIILGGTTFFEESFEEVQVTLFVGFELKVKAFETLVFVLLFFFRAPDEDVAGIKLYVMESSQG